MLGEHWVTSPGYFDPRNFHNNVAAFMDRFGLDLERKSTEEIEHQMPQIYRDVEKSLISFIRLIMEISPTSTITIEITIAVTGRFIKVSAIICSD